MRSELVLLPLALLLGAAAPVTLPFAPPTGVPIGYDCSAQRSLGGRPVTVNTRHELRFAGSGDDRRLRWTMTALTVDGDAPVRQILQAAGDVAVGQPVDIALSAAGAATAIRNEAELRATVRAAVPGVRQAIAPLIAPAPGAARDVLQALLDDELDALDPASSEAFAARWLETVEPLLGGEAPLVPDEVVETQVDAEAPIGGGALRYQLRYGLRDYVPGKSAVLFHTMTADPEDVQRMAEALVAQLFPDAAPGQNEATATRAMLAQMTSSTDMTSTISLPTGLRASFATTTRTTLPGRPARSEGRRCTLRDTSVL